MLKDSGVDPLVFWVFEHPHNFGRWCSPVSEHPQIFPENMRFLPANGVHLQSIFVDLTIKTVFTTVFTTVYSLINCIALPSKSLIDYSIITDYSLHP